MPYEFFSSNRNPTDTAERLWESIDLIIKAWTTHDGPFNFEGRWIHKRQVNVWPRPYQQPYPRVWTTGGSSLEHACRTVERGFVYAMFLTPADRIAMMYNSVRDYCRAEGLPQPADDQFAFMPLVAVGETEAEAREMIDGVFWYVTHNKAELQFRAPPGYVETPLLAQFITGKSTGGRSDAIRTRGVEYFRDNHVAIYGTPDSVVSQIKSLYKKVGGFGQLIAMMHAGGMSFELAAKSMRLFAEQVVPEIKNLGSISAEFGPLAERKKVKPRTKRKKSTRLAAAAE